MKIEIGLTVDGYVWAIVKVSHLRQLTVLLLSFRKFPLESFFSLWKMQRFIMSLWCDEGWMVSIGADSITPGLMRLSISSLIACLIASFLSRATMVAVCWDWSARVTWPLRGLVGLVRYGRATCLSAYGSSAVKIQLKRPEDEFCHHRLFWSSLWWYTRKWLTSTYQWGLQSFSSKPKVLNINIVPEGK